MTCAACGHVTSTPFKFCPECGAAAETPAAREQRKIVSVVFCDLADSTALGDTSDPETLRGTMRGYYEEMRAILERHGGTVEKFIGDAVMAVFGVPVVREDDALRAVRAASEMRSSVAKLGLSARIGVNTGRVVGGTGGEALVTGDAVNVAARLEQGAAPGEILIGKETWQSVRAAVDAEPVTLDVKGKPLPVDAFRLLFVDLDAPAFPRNLGSRLIGRERERARLRDDFERVCAERTCHLFTLLGVAGIGKSRLVLDFIKGAESARVVRGRCVPYGDGITYYPLVEVVLQLDADPGAVLASSPAETQANFRHLLENVAAEQPLVVVFDDVQWSERVFLDLVEHVVDWSREAPIFVICIGRPELVDKHPGWGGGKANATTLLLEPLPREALADVLAERDAANELDAVTRARILEAADGNPLFVEEMAAVARESDGAVTVPPTIQALLQARLDLLDPDERLLLEHGAIEGEVFHREAVLGLVPTSVAATAEKSFLSLMRKELVRPTNELPERREGFRFRHLLIRDAVYEAVPKAERAVLHERFAAWLEANAHFVEHDEIVGYHLEQAARYREELGSRDDDVAARASARLAAAGTRSLGRGDYGGGIALLRRATALFPRGDERRVRLLPELAYALLERAEPRPALDAAVEAADSGDASTRARAEIAKIEAELQLGVASFAEVRPRLDAARSTLRTSEDRFGLARGSVIEATYLWSECRAEAARAIYEEGLAIAEEIGYAAAIDGFMTSVAACYVFGPIPVAEATRRIEAMHETACARDLRLARITTLRSLGRLRAITGDSDVAHAAVDESFDLWRDSGQDRLYWSAWAQTYGFLARVGGDVAEEERILRAGIARLEELQDRTSLPTLYANLARSLLAQERLEEAAAVAARARKLTIPDDITNALLADGVDAVILSRTQMPDEARRLSERTFTAAQQTDFWQLRAWAWLVSAAVRGRESDLREAIAIYERKGATAVARQAKPGFLF